MSAPTVAEWNGMDVKPGTQKRLRLEVGESYTGLTVRLPLLVWRAPNPGPTVFISSSVHGDEINGTGTIRALMDEEADLHLERGALVLLPVVNIMGFERHTRYMPDRRDLNRAFPGSETGSLTARLAHLLATEIIPRCDYGIDLHTAAVRRTNFPNVRADMNDPDCAELAKAFGCSVIVDGGGPEGSFRRCATSMGCPTIILEAGEVWKVERMYLETALRGIKNCLAHLEMIPDEREPGPDPWVVKSTHWVRAGAGGFLQFHVSPGEFVEKDQVIATNAGLLGREQEQILSPRTGVVIGMTTMPAVSPGDPIAHIAQVPKRAMAKREKALDLDDHTSYDTRLREDLASNVHKVEIEDEA